MELAQILGSIVRRFVPSRIYGAAWAIYEAGHIQIDAVGFTTYSGREGVTPDTWFDLASLTKVVGTLPAILVASQNHRLTLDDSAGQWLPELSQSVGNQTIRALLSHTAGLPPGFEDVVPPSVRTPDGIWRHIRDLSVAEGEHEALYSDIGYFLLGQIIERVWEKPFVRVVQEILAGVCVEVQERIDSQALSVAATRYCPERQHIIQGEPQNRVVAIWGRAAGHAGLFSTAPGILHYGLWWLSLWDHLPFQEAVQRVVPGRGLGWMLPGCPELPRVPWPSDAFGHTGFTGTSLVVIPSRRLVAVLLTNRTHPRMDNPWIRPLREEFYSALLANTSGY